MFMIPNICSYDRRIYTREMIIWNLPVGSHQEVGRRVTENVYFINLSRFLAVKLFPLTQRRLMWLYNEQVVSVNNPRFFWIYFKPQYIHIQSLHRCIFSIPLHAYPQKNLLHTHSTANIPT